MVATAAYTPTNSVREFTSLHTPSRIHCLWVFWWWPFRLVWGDTWCGLDFFTLREGSPALAFPPVLFLMDFSAFSFASSPYWGPHSSNLIWPFPWDPTELKGSAALSRTPGKRTAIFRAFISSFPRDCALLEYSDRCSHALNKTRVAWKKFYFFLRG